MKKSSLTCVTSVVLLQVILCVRGEEIVAFYRGKSLRTLAKDGQGKVYVGGINEIIQLYPNLTLSVRAETGPRDDNLHCPPDPRKDCSEIRKPTNYTSVLLVVDFKNNVLISCSTLYYGFCEKYSLTDLQLRATIYKQVITNSELSVVGMVADGFGNDQDLLYIGSAPSILVLNEYVRGGVPMLASRNLNTLEIAHKLDSSASFIDYQVEYQKTGHITFKEVFEYENYIYYLTVQRDRVPPRESAGNYRSHLVRICKHDENYRSYIQIPLQCAIWPATFNIAQAAYLGKPGKKLATMPGFAEDQMALFVSFSQSFDKSELIKSTSALCVYSMEEIAAKFAMNLADCFRGNGQIGPEFLRAKRGCEKITANIGSSYCGDHDMNYPIEGTAVAVPQVAKEISRDIVNSILVKNTGDTTIAYLGTNNGKLHSMIVHSSAHSNVYRSIQISDTSLPIRRHMLFDNEDKKEHIYLMTTSQVYKIKLYNCTEHTSCDTCVGGNEPHCGWCFHFNKCMTQNECPKAATYPDFVPWLSHEFQCPVIMSLTPDPVGYDAIQNISMIIELNKLPKVPEKDLFCELEADIFIKKSPAKWQAGNQKVIVTCQPFENLQSLPNNQGNLTAKVYVKLGQNIKWTSSPLTVYDCSARSDSCHICTSSGFPCTWCMTDNTCISRDQTCPTANGAVGSDRCPSIELLDNKELLSHAGVNKVFTVRATNIQPPLTQYKCKFTIQGQVKTVAAKFNNGNLDCNLIALDYTQTIPHEFADLDVVWGDRNLPLDNPNSIQVKVYKCEAMETHCGTCLVLAAMYECGWCPAGDRQSGLIQHCSLRGDCKTTWKDRNQDCRNVQIQEINPKSGPVNGGTNVTISGRNMGKIKSELTSVTVAGVKCDVLEYEPSVRFVCKTDSTKNKTSGPVRVSVKGKYNGTSDLLYQFINPVLRDFLPKTGPIAGGTNVTIVGQNLDVGNTALVSIDGEACQVLDRNYTHLRFTTIPQDHPIEADILLKIDDSEDFKLPKKFTYSENPVINKIHPYTAILSGGNLLNIYGQNLQSVQETKFYVNVGSELYQTDCKPQSGDLMQCPTPSLRHLRSDIDGESTFHYGFLMDGVMSLRNISASSKFEPITYHADPNLFKFTSVQKYQRNLVIKGKDILFIQELSDGLTVTVGGVACTGEKIVSSTELHCIPPMPEQMKGRTDRKGNAQVVVTLGNYKATLGAMRYTSGMALSTGAIIGIILGMVAMIALVIVVIVLIRRKKKRAKKNPPSMIYNPKKATVNEYEGAAEEPGATDQLLGDTQPAADAPVGKQDEDSYISLVLARLENQKLRRHVLEVLIPRKRLEVGEPLGKGHFGQVFLATLLNSDMENPKQVAVKTLQGTDLDQKQIENFLREGVIMKNFNHVHIMRLMGVCIGPNQEPMVILPFMCNGDLRTYVKDKKKNFTARQLLHLAQQVAEGMAYLASLNFVHRDLAARNCMIDDCETVKVADFGLTREIYEREYYSLKDKKAKLPIKWMALESLEDFVFTTKSDVWSFGVLMWELMTRGVTPYPDVDAFDLRTYLASSRRLRKPKYCPDNVYKIMMDCWDEIPERRSTFADLVNRLELLLNPPKKRSASQEESDYQNVDSLKKDDYLNPVTGEMS